MIVLLRVAAAADAVQVAVCVVNATAFRGTHPARTDRDVKR